ncbi:AroM family protein [Aquamicrobium terrae]|uniref:DNA-binding NarL/FixJ family response regulator n=1 Tax=Aquamicrobium terrae TaxID=1324945 RepID=A0ABV2N1C7_9HYPH
MFVSVGRSPRKDLIGEIVENLDIPIEVFEVGALDGLPHHEIEKLKATPHENSIVSRLDDTRRIVLSKAKMTERMSEIVGAFPPGAYDLVVILSTGLFGEFESTCPTVNTQRAIESAVLSLAAAGDVVGLVQPLSRQTREIESPAFDSYQLHVTHAEEGDRASLATAILDLSACSIIVLNSVGFTEADRLMMAKASGKPIVLARRIMASAIRLLLNRPTPVLPSPSIPAEFAERLSNLTARERQVLSLAAEGLSNKAIARQLGISPKTVEIHRSNMMRKMEVSSSGALIRMVVEAGYR